MYRLMYVIHVNIKFVDTYLLHGCAMLNGDVVDRTICLRVVMREIVALW